MMSAVFYFQLIDLSTLRSPKVIILFLSIFVFSHYHSSGQANHQYTNTVYETSAGKVSQTTIRHDSYKFDYASYSIFVPDSIKYIRGIFIHQHGCTMEGTGAATAYDVQYEAFARKWHLAIIGPDIYPTPGASCSEWINPEDGSGSALLRAIDSFAKVTDHPELKQAPWLLWGHSGGGYWVLKMMTEYPKRILAAFCYSAAFDPNLNYPSAAAKIPIILRHAGKTDLDHCWQTATHAFLKLRSMGSYASLAYNAGQTHNLSYVRYMAVPFFESVLSQRLPDAGEAALKDMDVSKAWLGDTLTYNLYKYATYKGNKSAMSLFPDSICAVKWKEYVSTGTVVDRTIPPSPYALKINHKNDKVFYLTWNVRGDVESPIQYFNVYKNNELIGRFPKVGDYQSFNTNGDNAMPIIPCPIEFLISPSKSKPDIFSVSAVNQFNLESTREEISTDSR
jgi:pimeloyl-ACP methyl ester carboxylesterase